MSTKQKVVRLTKKQLREMVMRESSPNLPGPFPRAPEPSDSGLSIDDRDPWASYCVGCGDSIDDWAPGEEQDKWVEDDRGNHWCGDCQKMNAVMGPSGAPSGSDLQPQIGDENRYRAKQAARAAKRATKKHEGRRSRRVMEALEPMRRRVDKRLLLDAVEDFLHDHIVMDGMGGEMVDSDAMIGDAIMHLASNVADVIVDELETLRDLGAVWE